MFPFRRMRWTAIALALMLGVAALGAQDAVRVTVARANVRAEPNDRAAVLTQVTSGTLLTLRKVEGDWFQVELPPDPRMGNARVEGFISRKVAAPAAGVRRPAETATATEPSHVRSGLSVAIEIDGKTQWLMPEVATVRALDARPGTLPALAGMWPADNPPLKASGDDQVTFVWTVDRNGDRLAMADRRPDFFVMFKDADAAWAADLAPVLVRLIPTLAGPRLVSAVAGRANQATTTTAEWDVPRLLQQEVVRTTTEYAEAGATHMRPAAELPMGEYAIVMRAKRGRLFSGPSVLSPETAEPPFALVWPFSAR